MKLPSSHIVTCWGLTKSVNAHIIKANDVDELQECIKLAKNSSLQIAIMGGGNSYTDVFMNSNQIIVDTSNFNSIKDFDLETGIITVESGVRVGDLLAVILPKNWSLIGLSGSANDRIGGMLSSNTHGKDTWHAGNFSQNILSLKLLVADGTIKEVERCRDSDLFNAVVGGLGFLGIIIEVTMKLKRIPSFMVKTNTRRIRNLDNLFETFYSLDDKETDFSYGLIDPFAKGSSFGRGQMESSSYIDVPNNSTLEFDKFLTPKSRIGPLSPETFWSLFRMIWSNNTNKMLNKFRYYRASHKKSIISYPKYQYVLSSTPKLNLLFAPSGFMEFQCLFPKKSVIEAFSELLLTSQQFKRPSFICGIKRHIPDPSFLSFAGDGLSITINFGLNNFKKIEREKYCDKLLETVLKFNGKVYISKHAFLPKKIFQEMYPKYKNILEFKNQYDPENIFASDATKRLLHN